MKTSLEKIIDAILLVITFCVGFMILKFAFTFLYESGKAIFKNLF